MIIFESLIYFFKISTLMKCGKNHAYGLLIILNCYYNIFQAMKISVFRIFRKKNFKFLMSKNNSKWGKNIFKMLSCVEHIK